MLRNLILAVLLALASDVRADVQLDQAVIKNFTDCSSGGSVAQTLTGGSYVMTVHDEAVWLCLADSASTCASGGSKFPAGFGMVIRINNGGQSVSCRSAASGGDLTFTRKGN